tara:strand:+ start:2412 stop:2723 length:312 start_codon:yes stop_codon:yes gene_type:complete
MKLIILVLVIFLSTLGFSQTDHTYIITINNSENTHNQKEYLTVLRDYFETKNCVYHLKKKVFLITTQTRYNINQLKTDIENKGNFIIQNIKQNGLELNPKAKQ